jgi:arylsulfatase A-like enzyme/glycosyltransferase involved in cell wall biosynthesis
MAGDSGEVLVDRTGDLSATLVKLTVLICTHNRAELLERTLASLDAATRPASCLIEILVVANACTDDTASLLEKHAKAEPRSGKLPLRWLQEPTPGKSHALNRAIPLIDGDLVAFVDDDHRVDPGYLTGVCRAAESYPDATLFCGRIQPDWDGTEPRWVHDNGPYRIFPLPVPRSEYGDEPRRLTSENVLPGGGNLFIRRPVFDRVGGFSAELGPHGHDLGGGEDSDFVNRCLAAGESLQYVPWVVQHHYVDSERLRLGYLLRKAFQRSRYVTRARAVSDASVPLYIWRKLGTYLVYSACSISWPRTRFFLMRVAAALGELRGFVDKAHEQQNPPRRASMSGRFARAAWTMVPAFVFALALMASAWTLRDAIAPAVSVALLCTAILVGKSFHDFSQTGPPLEREILREYWAYSLFALLRLALWALVLCTAMAWIGVVLYAAACVISGTELRVGGVVASAATGILALTAFQISRHLLYLPGSIAASSHYRASRLYPIWRQLTPQRLHAVQWLGGCAGTALFATAAVTLLHQDDQLAAAGFALLAVLVPIAALVRLLDRDRPASAGRKSNMPNVLMIGSDTLRADRIGTSRDGRSLAPFIESLADRGTHFTACYVPCARTAPSLLSLLTGTWPHHHGARDNFVSDEDVHLAVPGLASILGRHGYRSAAVSDWSGGDLGKFSLGFDILDLPSDQWNIKYLIRQGPKDLRLFLSLFTHNRFGKWVLPELYDLAGVPLTSFVGRDARALITRFAEQGEPFLLNVFMSTTHPPFGSEYPYYTLWSDKTYAGESKFVMARLTDPWEIIRRQADTRTDFDLDQIVALYDGCVRNFDDEVRHIINHLEACRLVDNTIIVIYSDHGMEFFEHDTWGQGNSVRGDFSARIPLIIVDPRLRGTGPCSRVVRSIDIVPTLLELARVAPNDDLDGVSLVPYLNGDETDLELPAFNETGIWLTDLPSTPADHLRYPGLLDLLEVPNRATGTLAIKHGFRQAIIDAKDRMIRLGSWKLTYEPMKNGARYALFDLATDPDCRHDVSETYPTVVRELQSRLLAWISGRAS